jgi:hypothetical protein
MVEMDSIRELAEKIVQIYHPRQVILFGSAPMNANGGFRRRSCNLLETKVT